MSFLSPLLIYLFTHLLICSFTYLLMCLFTYLLICLFTYFFTRSSIHLFIGLFTASFFSGLTSWYRMVDNTNHLENFHLYISLYGFYESFFVEIYKVKRLCFKHFICYVSLFCFVFLISLRLFFVLSLSLSFRLSYSPVLLRIIYSFLFLLSIFVCLSCRRFVHM